MSASSVKQAMRTSATACKSWFLHSKTIEPSRAFSCLSKQTVVPETDTTNSSCPERKAPQPHAQAKQEASLTDGTPHSLPLQGSPLAPVAKTATAVAPHLELLALPILNLESKFSGSDSTLMASDAQNPGSKTCEPHRTEPQLHCPFIL